MLTYFTTGESHGKALVTVIDGFPYATPVDLDFINKTLRRRQGGYGRSDRMRLEKDHAQILSGVRNGTSIGSPITIMIQNRAYRDHLPPVTRARPGHADFAGAAKFLTTDARNVSERASARETAARVAAGAIANQFLNLFGIQTIGFVRSIAGVTAEAAVVDPDKLIRNRNSSFFYLVDPQLDNRVKNLVDVARKEGDTLGGIFEVNVFNVPAGLGSHSYWDKKLSSKIAAAVMSIQSVKGIEIGLGFKATEITGSMVHDEFTKDRQGRIIRTSNNAGGIEGGISNGQTIVVRAACKPISTLKSPLRTVNIKTKRQSLATYERSDICVVPAASVVGESVVAFEIAQSFLEKFGADTFDGTRKRFLMHLKGLKKLSYA